MFYLCLVVVIHVFVDICVFFVILCIGMLLFCTNYTNFDKIGQQELYRFCWNAADRMLNEIP